MQRIVYIGRDERMQQRRRITEPACMRHSKHKGEDAQNIYKSRRVCNKVEKK